MAFSPDIQHDIDRQAQKVKNPGAPGPARFGSAWAAAYIRKYGLQIERLALGDEPPEALRARLDAAYDAQAPASPTAVALVEQATMAQIEIGRLHQVRATLRAHAIRTAEQRWQWSWDDDVRYYIQMFNQDANSAVAGLKRSAPGVRHLISRWEELTKCLSDEGTWYGAHRCEAILMQGYSACIDELFYSEAAWQTWMDCLVCQPLIRQSDINTLCDQAIVPKAILDRQVPLWQPDPAASRARLWALVDRELPALRALEAELRTRYEEPSRAAAREQALARFERENRHLVLALRSQERALSEAHRALGRHPLELTPNDNKRRTC
jgi:hypothetical protein